MTSPTIAALIAHVTSECNAVDVESRFDAMLDESYSFEKVGGPFENLTPSRVLRECDSTAHRCGCVDFSDSEPWTEVEGSYYEDDALDAAKAEFVEGWEAELAAAEKAVEQNEKELEDANDDSDTNAIAEDLNHAREAVKTLTAELAELEAHSF